MLALAAKHHAVPVIVCCGIFKLSPRFPSNPDSLETLSTPSFALPHHETRVFPPSFQPLNPVYDYVPPEFIWMYVTNLGGYNSTYIYRLLADLYSEEDYNLAITTDPGLDGVPDFQMSSRV